MADSSTPRKRKSSGFDYLWSELGTLSSAARHDVFNLLGSATVAKMKQVHGDAPTTKRIIRSKQQIQRQIVTSSTTGEEALSMAAASKVSILGSICFMFVASSNNETTPVKEAPVNPKRQTIDIIRQCGFAVDPQRSPGRLDARTMVLAALFFLCETSYLKPVHKGTTTSKVTADLTKRTYEKAYDWKWEDIKHKVTGELEDAFYDDDPKYYEFLARKRFLAPTSGSDDDRLQLLLRGTIPTPVSKTSLQNEGSIQSNQVSKQA